MKTFITLCAVIAFGSFCRSETVTVDGELFLLASSSETKAEKLHEFLPKGQSLSDWTRLVSIRQVSGQKAPKDYAAVLAQAYHAAYPHMKFAAEESGDVWFLDYIVYPRKKTKPTFAEWDFFVVRKHPTGGVVVCQYAVRASSMTSLDDAFEKLGPESLRERMLAKLKTEPFTEEPDHPPQ